MTEKELSSFLLCSTSMSDFDIHFYRKASSISISVFSLGLFGDVREQWSQPRVACAPWLCYMGREDVQLYFPSGPCSTVGLQKLLRGCLAGFFFPLKNKVLTCKFNLCRWLITINQFPVVALCKSPANLPPVLFPNILISRPSLCP